MDLIKKVKLSKKNLVVGEPLLVQVDVSDAAVDVSINGIYGARQFIQFPHPGSYTVAITAALRNEIQQAGELVKVRAASPDALQLPIIWATQDRYQPRVIALSIANASVDLQSVQEYTWSFGDGTQGASRDGAISHDYTGALGRDSVYCTFDVQV